MATLEDLTARKAALEKAIASPLRRGASDGESIEHRSVDELRRALAEVEKDIASLSGTTRRRRYYPSTGRGY
ncbi:MAG: hypothetical protein AAF183_17955 [Pseudomonadota bacterium]